MLGSSTVCRPEEYEQTKFPVVSSPSPETDQKAEILHKSFKISHTITKYDANILNHHAKSGDALELGRTLDTIAQREAPNGYDRADIPLLAKDSQLPRQEWRRLGVSQNTRPTDPARGSEDPNGMDRAVILLLAKDSQLPRQLK